ncbi:MAG: LamG domain-containing protein [Spirochaetales bacterium]|nr:LamG domain-containing protein [Spirochaetales bacterium]
MIKHITLATLLILIPLILVADELELTNGDTITGRIITMDSEKLVIETEYGRLEIKRKFVKKGLFSGDNREITASDKIEYKKVDENGQEITIPSKGLVSELLFDSEFTDGASSQYSLKNIGDLQFCKGIDNVEKHGVTSDGEGSYLVLSGHKDLDELSAFTISFWIYVKDWEKTQYILSKWSSTNGDKASGKFAVYTKQGFVLCYIVDTTGTYHHVFTEKPMKINDWNHIAVTFEKGNALIYINNEVQGKKTFDIPGLKKDSSPLYILTAKASKGDIYSFYNFTGKLDNLRFYNQALPVSGIESLFLEKN